ncbi:hypothetical protein B0H17DRAFT_1147870 [Mycena rosella]|uniref:Uncharacterized protein n=1 Tax=Mycena rosella TaxID=1033263 RepID=A0AAD7G091_MYCRO|nr:hypothetical protein B0H17DRAFT_1147870 [Mycena rosella]
MGAVGRRQRGAHEAGGFQRAVEWEKGTARGMGSAGRSGRALVCVEVVGAANGGAGCAPVRVEAVGGVGMRRGGNDERGRSGRAPVRVQAVGPGERAQTWKQRAGALWTRPRFCGADRGSRACVEGKSKNGGALGTPRVRIEAMGDATGALWTRPRLCGGGGGGPTCPRFCGAGQGGRACTEGESKDGGALGAPRVCIEELGDATGAVGRAPVSVEPVSAVGRAPTPNPRMGVLWACPAFV